MVLNIIPQLKIRQYEHSLRVRKMVTLTVVLLLFAATDLAWCHPDGAPPMSCGLMLPGHYDRKRQVLVSDQMTSSPYTVRASWDNERKYIRISVFGDTVQGFIIQGKTSANGSAVGRFTKLSSNSKYQNCKDHNYELGTSLTHTNPADKKNLVFFWEPPFNTEGQVTFYATLAKSKDIYWLKQPSNSVFFDMRTKNETTTLAPSTQTLQPTPYNKSGTDALNPGSNTASLSVPLNTLLMMVLLTLAPLTKLG